MNSSRININSTLNVNNHKGGNLIWLAAERIFLDRVKSYSYDERHLLPLELVLLLLVVLLAPLLVLINGRGDLLEHPEHPRLQTIHYKKSLQYLLCFFHDNDITVVFREQVARVDVGS